MEKKQVNTQEQSDPSVETKADKENKEKSTECFEYQLFDAEGVEVCVAKIESKQSEECPGSQEVISYFLESPSGGQPIDLIALTGVSDLRVFMKKGGEMCFSRKDLKTGGRSVHIPSPDSLLDIGTALHEIGHAVQAEDDRFRDLDYGTENYLTSSDQSDLLGLWDKIALNLQKRGEKSEYEHVSSELVQDLNRLFTERIKVQRIMDERDVKIAVLQKEMKKFVGFIVDGQNEGSSDKVQFFTEKYNEIRDEARGEMEQNLKDLEQKGEINQKLFSLLIENQDKLKLEAGVATRVLERDATKRAFLWMRKLKQKHEIDLFAAQQKDEVSKRDVVLEEGSKKRGMNVEGHELLYECDEGQMNAYGMLKSALGTYQAERSENYRKKKDGAEEEAARNRAISLANSTDRKK